MKVAGYHTYFVTGSVDANPVWVHNDCTPPNLAQIGDIINVSTFTERVRINGEQFLRDPDTGYLIQRDRGGTGAHGGSAYKLFGRPTGSANPPRLWTLRRDGLVLRP
jgi:hypothetical protein